MTRLGIDEAMRQAVELHQAGRLAEAEAIYRQVLEQQPSHVDALRLLGVLSHQSGRHDTAIDLLCRATKIQPDSALAFGSLGTALLAAGDTEAAIGAYQQAIRLKPDYAEAHCNLGSALAGARRYEEAISSCRHALQLKPDFANAYNNLGFALEAAGRIEEADLALRRAIELRPAFAEAHNNLGNILKKQERFEDSIAEFRCAIRINPAYAEAYNNLGNLLARIGSLEDAVAMLRQAIQLKPDYGEAYSNLSAALKDQGEIKEALAAASRGAELAPDHAQAHHNLGFILCEGGEFDSAVAEFNIALRLEPNLAESYNGLGNALKGTGQIEESVACYERAAALAPDQPQLAQNLIFSRYFLPGTDPASIHQATLDWNRRYARPLRGEIRPHARVHDSPRRLKIGYVSPDLVASHPVGRFLLPVLQQHDRQEFEITCYSTARHSALELDPFVRGSDHCRDISMISDQRAAEQIRQDRIDILVDLAMHISNGRLLIFARKPAPVQVTWLSYPGSTGLDTMDYRITDPYLDPPGLDDEFYSEQSIRLPNCWYCYSPPAGAAAVNPLPSLTSGCITFGCLNNFGKVNSSVLKTWSTLLGQTPGSRLLLYAPPGSARQRVERIFAEAGVAAERLTFAKYVPMKDYFALYHMIDIALDPFPFAGGTTSCDALWMGVPVVTLQGIIAAGRGTGMLLHNLGLADLIAASKEDYVRIAAELAGDVPRLTQLRATLRERMSGSALMDLPRFTRDLDATYSGMWRKWCASPA